VCKCDVCDDCFVQLLQRMWLLLLQVSLFVELFNEMLIRDFGFCIYNALLACPDKPQEVIKPNDGKKKGIDKRSDNKKRSEKDNVDHLDKGSSELKKDAGGDEVRFCLIF